MSSVTVEQIAEAGVVGAGGAGFPTHVKLQGQADTAIINAAECEPLLHKDKEVLRTFAEQVIADHRRMLGRGLTREGYDLLASLVDDPAGGPPADELAGELFDLGLIRVFPSPGGTCYLPHPLLIPSLRRQGG